MVTLGQLAQAMYESYNTFLYGQADPSFAELGTMHQNMWYEIARDADDKLGGITTPVGSNRTEV